MARYNRYSKEQLLADWRAGGYTQQELADKHKTGRSNVARLVSGIEKKYRVPIKNPMTTVSRYVYIITCAEFEGDGVFKIGIAGDIKTRIASLQTACPYKLYALSHYEPINPLMVETMLHALFHKKRMTGEWFKLSKSDLNIIEEIMANVDYISNKALNG